MIDYYLLEFHKKLYKNSSNIHWEIYKYYIYLTNLGETISGLFKSFVVFCLNIGFKWLVLEDVLILTDLS